MSHAMAEPTGRGGRIVKIRAEDERQFTAHLGMVIFLASWAMMFAALFFSYALLRLRAPAWPPPGVPPLPLALPAINTLVLILSSLTFHRGLKGLRATEPGRPRLLPWLLVTSLLGVAFLGLQGVVWHAQWQAGLTWATGAYGSMLWLLTAFHAAHVVVGLGFLAWLSARSARGMIGGPAAVPVHLVAMFWHFVDVVWVLIFLTVYLA